MQLRRLLFLGLLLGAEAAQIVRRQSASSSAGGSTPTSNDVATTSSPASDNTPTSPADNSTPSDNGSSGGGSTSAGNDDDTTVTKTTTVTSGSAGTVTQKTTVMSTSTSTILVTSTDFTTTTVTSRDADTATKTIWSTSTVWANQKRAIDLAPRTVGLEDLRIEAEATAVPTVTQINTHEIELVRNKRNLQKRATITAFVTVTVGKDSQKTITDTQTKVVISTVSDETTITNTVTETEQADAKTTITVTSTLTITSTAVTTGIVMTATLDPTNTGSGSSTGAPSSGDNSNSTKSSGLSTGAKAGIGAGVGVVGLIAIGALLWFLAKRRRRGPKPDPDDMFGSSEVPVGRGSPPPVSQHNRDTAAAIIAPRRAPTKPNSPEGYRGTALGDGRTGFAKPEAFGSAYSAVSPETNYTRTTASNTPHPDVAEMQSPANTAELGNDGSTGRWHDSNAAEIDGNQVTRPTGSGPPANVYEMPEHAYR